MADTKDYWFPTRSYGLGWGLPTAWQGWLVYTVATILLVAGFFFIRPVTTPLQFQIYSGGVVLLLLAVCWIKGEPPRWRWGK
jgi:lipoprotein signal peptidase